VLKKIIMEAHLHVEKERGLSMKLPNREFVPYVNILARGSNED
jgi:hypothetical protein